MPAGELEPHRHLTVAADAVDQVEAHLVREARGGLARRPAGSAGEDVGTAHPGQDREQRRGDQQRGGGGRRHEAAERQAGRQRVAVPEARQDVQVDEARQDRHGERDERRQVEHHRRVDAGRHRRQEEEEDADPGLPLVALARQRPELGGDAEQRQVQHRPHQLDAAEGRDVEHQDRQVGEAEQVERAVAEPALDAQPGAAQSERHQRDEQRQHRPLESVVERQRPGHQEGGDAQQQPLLARESHGAPALGIASRSSRAAGSPEPSGSRCRGAGSTSASASSNARRWRAPEPNGNRRSRVSELDLEAALEMVDRRRRRLGDQTLEAVALDFGREPPDAVVEHDHEPQALLGLALLEDQRAGLRALLPMDGARVVALPEGAQRVQLVSPAGARRRAVADLARRVELDRARREELGVDQQLDAQRVAHPLAEEAERKERGEVRRLDPLPAAAREEQLERATRRRARGQMRHQPHRPARRDREEQQPARQAPAAVAHGEGERHRTAGEEVEGRRERHRESAQVPARRDPRHHQQGEHRGEHEVEGVVAGVGGRDRDHDRQQDEPEADLGDADPLGRAPPSMPLAQAREGGPNAAGPPHPSRRAPGNRHRGAPSRGL